MSARAVKTAAQKCLNCKFYHILLLWQKSYAIMYELIYVHGKFRANL